MSSGAFSLGAYERVAYRLLHHHTRTTSHFHTNMYPRRLLPLLLLCLAATGCESMSPGYIDRIQPYSDAPRAGNVYLLRGFIGIWSYGINDLGEKVEASGVRASIFQEDQWEDVASAIAQRYRNANDAEPIVLIGHSYGADDALKIAHRLEDQGMKVDLIITLDPVVPPKVPSNVKLVYNIYQPSLLDGLPFFRGVPLETSTRSATNLRNVNIRGERKDLLVEGTDHFNIEKNPRIHDEVVRKVHEFCPPREQWVMQQMITPGTYTPPTASVKTAGGAGAAPSAAPPALSPAAKLQPPAATYQSDLDRIP